jgi:hypothetical protein
MTILRPSRLALFMIAALLVPAGAAADPSGQIEGVSVDPSLTQASVQNLSGSYDLCATEQAEELACSWTAMAMLAPPQFASCPTNGIFGLPPGLPGGPSASRVWFESATGDGTVESGSLTFPLDAVNDEHLCLYINRPAESAPSAVSDSGIEPRFVPLTLVSELVAGVLLHVDVPPAPAPEALPAPTAPAVTSPSEASRPPDRCHKRRVRRKGRCVRARPHHRHHRPARRPRV